MIDLHQHSTFSDGTDDIKSLILKNIDVGIKYMSVTDHDNIDSLKFIEEMNYKLGINYVSGIEFSTDFNGESIHILAYGYSSNDELILSLVEESRVLRLKRIEQHLETLKSEFGIEFNNAVLSEIKKAKNPNKPMIANIMMKLGYGTNITEIMNKYLYHKLTNEKLKTIDVLRKLKNSSAISVWAHPLGGVGEKRVDKFIFENRLKEFIENGLGGLECFYSLYSEDEQKYLVSSANKSKLLISGGSDYHGLNKNVEIGELSNYGFTPNLDQLTIFKHLKFRKI